MKKLLQTAGWIRLPVQTAVYPVQTIYSAGYVFLDRAYFYLQPDGKNAVSVWISPKKKTDDLELLAKEFYQELLNYAHYFISLKSNGDHVRLLLQRALFSAAPSLVKEAEEREIQQLIKELEQEDLSASKKKQSRKSPAAA